MSLFSMPGETVGAALAKGAADTAIAVTNNLGEASKQTQITAQVTAKAASDTAVALTQTTTAVANTIGGAFTAAVNVGGQYLNGRNQNNQLELKQEHEMNLRKQSAEERKFEMEYTVVRESLETESARNAFQEREFQRLYDEHQRNPRGLTYRQMLKEQMKIAFQTHFLSTHAKQSLLTGVSASIIDNYYPSARSFMAQSVSLAFPGPSEEEVRNTNMLIESLHNQIEHSKALEKEERQERMQEMLEQQQYELLLIEQEKRQQKLLHVQYKNMQLKQAFQYQLKTRDVDDDDDYNSNTQRHQLTSRSQALLENKHNHDLNTTVALIPHHHHPHSASTVAVIPHRHYTHAMPTDEEVDLTGDDDALTTLTDTLRSTSFATPSASTIITTPPPPPPPPRPVNKSWFSTLNPFKSTPTPAAVETKTEEEEEDVSTESESTDEELADVDKETDSILARHAIDVESARKKVKFDTKPNLFYCYYLYLYAHSI